MSEHSPRKKPSNEELFVLVHQLAEKLGRRPMKKEFQYGELAKHRFKSWGAFLKSAGLPTTPKEVSDEELFALIRQEAEKLERRPAQREFVYGALAKNRFKSWRAFIELAGLPFEPEMPSKEELIELLQQQTAELGRRPRRREFQYGQYAKNQFGSWEVFLRRAGLSSSVKGYSKEELITFLQQEAEKLGRTPRRIDFRYKEINEKFGSWKAFVESAGLKPSNQRGPSNQELFSLAQKQANKLGRPPRRNEFQYEGLVKDRFDSWKDFLELAGLLSESAGPSKEELPVLLQQRADELGRIPKKREFQYGDLAKYHFGSWQRFVDGAELKLKPKPKQTVRRKRLAPSNEELIALIQQEAKELGRTPLKKEFRYGKLVRYRFGSWKDFVESAGLTLITRNNPIGLSKEQLIAALQQETTRLGRLPKRKEFPHANEVNKNFDSWADLVRRAGLEEFKPSKQELIVIVQRETKKIGRTPLKKEFQYGKLAQKRFGSWKNFVESAGLELVKFSPEERIRRKNHTIMKNRLIESVRQQTYRLGRIPTITEFEDSELVIEKYDSWENFLQKTGLDLKNPDSVWKKLSKKDLIVLVQNRASQLGRTPYMREFEFIALVLKKFGTWGNFLKNANLEKAPRPRPNHKKADETEISKEELIALVRKTAKSLGHVPTMKEFNYSGLAKIKYGRWTTFLREAGLASGEIPGTESFRGWLRRTRRIKPNETRE